MKKIYILLFVLILGVSFSANAEVFATVTRNSSFSRVASVQRALNQCLGTNITVDGVWGSRTTNAVVMFQDYNGLEPVGYIGRLTAQALNSCGDSNSSYIYTNSSRTVSRNSFNDVYSDDSDSSDGSMYNYADDDDQTAHYPSDVKDMLYNISAYISQNNNTPSIVSNNTGYSGIFPIQNNVSTPFPNANNSNTEGNLVNIVKMSYLNNTKVSAGAGRVPVLGLELTAREGDQTIDGVIVSFYNTNPNTNRKLTRYASEVIILLNDVEIGRKTVTGSDESNDVYTYRFTGMRGHVLRDQKARITVAVVAQNTIDSIDAANDNWLVSFGNSVSAPDSNFISSLSGNGRFRDYGSDTGNQFTSTIDFQQAGGSNTDVRYRVTDAGETPPVQTIQVSRSSPTNDKTLLAFTVRAENAAMRLQKIPITLTATGNGTGVAPNVEALVSYIKIYANGNLVTGESINGIGPLQIITIGGSSEMNRLIAANTDIKFEIRADIQDVEPGTGNVSTEFDEGDMIRADYTAANVSATLVELDNINEDTVQNRSGSVLGNEQTLRTLGVSVKMEKPIIAFTPRQFLGDNSNKAVFTIPITVETFDETLYVGQTIQAVGSYIPSMCSNTLIPYVWCIAPGVGTPPPATSITGTTALSFSINDSSNWGIQMLKPTTGDVTSTITSNATTVGNAWRLDANQKKIFTIQVVLSGGTSPAFNRIQLRDFKFFTNQALTTGATVQNLTPLSAFQTEPSPIF